MGKGFGIIKPINGESLPFVFLTKAEHLQKNWVRRRRIDG
jgi:hypothetical protein